MEKDFMMPSIIIMLSITAKLSSQAAACRAIQALLYALCTEPVTPQASLLTNPALASPCPRSPTGLRHHPTQYCSGKVNFSPTKKRATASRTPTTSSAATLLMIPAQDKGQLRECEEKLCTPEVHETKDPTSCECHLSRRLQVLKCTVCRCHSTQLTPVTADEK